MLLPNIQPLIGAFHLNISNIFCDWTFSFLIVKHGVFIYLNKFWEKVLLGLHTHIFKYRESGFISLCRYGSATKCLPTASSSTRAIKSQNVRRLKNTWLSLRSYHSLTLQKLSVFIQMLTSPTKATWHLRCWRAS